MMRSCSAALLVLGGMAVSADAQVYTSYYHSPSYGYSTGYAPGGFNGPLRTLDWRWWAGTGPYSQAYSYGYGGYDWDYATSYGPTTYTASYAPRSYSSGYTSSFYAPSYETAVSYAPSPYVSAPGVCCDPCGTGVTYGNPNCPGGNCGMNYQPNPSGGPQPDPSSQPSSSGSQKFENESSPTPATGNPPNGGPGGQTPPAGDDWRRRFERGTEPAPADGFEGVEGGAQYGPSERIEKRAPTNGDDSKSAPSGSDDSADSSESIPESPSESESSDAPMGEAEVELYKAPIPDPESALPLVNRDSRISDAPSVLPERRRLSARFSSPELARSEVDLDAVPRAEDLKLVRK